MTAAASTCMISSHPSSSCASNYMATVALIATSLNSASFATVMTAALIATSGYSVSSAAIMPTMTI